MRNPSPYPSHPLTHLVGYGDCNMVDKESRIIVYNNGVYKGFSTVFYCHPPICHDRVWGSDPLMGLATDVFNALVFAE
jgi:hypothetical protein